MDGPGCLSHWDMKTIKISSDLWQRAVKHAEAEGYSSLQEFIEHLLERELKRNKEAEALDEVERRLKGLGYLD
jgi:predicted CopG family antitoxin